MAPPLSLPLAEAPRGRILLAEGFDYISRQPPRNRHVGGRRRTRNVPKYPPKAAPKRHGNDSKCALCPQ